MCWLHHHLLARLLQMQHLHKLILGRTPAVSCVMAQHKCAARTCSTSSKSPSPSDSPSSSVLESSPQISLSSLKSEHSSEAPLHGEADRHSGVTVDLVQLPVCVGQDQFTALLKESLCVWRREGVAAVWLKMPLDRGHLIPCAAAQGFRFHHAEGSEAMLKLWLPADRADRTPQFATHQLGVSGIVIREDTKEVLVVQDKNRPHTLWKFPGGLADLGEDIDSTAVREVFEETGVRTEFQSILAFRQQHGQPGAFGRSDLYVLCRLRPLTLDLTPCSEEIRQCRWMSVDELRAQMTNVSSLTLRLTDVIRRGLDRGFDDVDIVQEKHKSLYRGMTFKMFFRPLGKWLTK
ncbi:nucleoside diphosphate-linked moiety X motif 6-like [Babylonia areolata]|uniref:nucleoside diphosphate-linked moiety X motif 6-like n=1 Tax=Babylonia areolata TaxID=304850 RepID=UPI003FD4A728